MPFRASIDLKRNLEIELLYNPHDESGVMGSIHYLSATVDAATGTREIEVIFDNSEGDLTSGVPGFLKIPNYGIIPEGKQGAGNKAWTFIDEIIIN